MMYYDYPAYDCGGDYYEPRETEIIRAIHKYVFPVILFIGTVGNIISIRYLYNLSVSVWSTCLYLVILTVVDLLVLYVKCGNTWFVEVTQKDLSMEFTLTSDAVCKVYLFIFQFIVHFGIWVVVSSAIETLILARFPHLAYKMCTIERAKAVMLFITVLLVCLNMHYFWTYGLLKYADTPTEFYYSCTYIEDFSEYFRDQIWPFLNLSVSDIVPMLVVAVCFFGSITTYFGNAKTILEMKPMLEKYFMDLKSLQELKVTMTVICLNFMIIATLNIMYQIVSYLIMNEAIEIPCSVKDKVDTVMMLISAVLETYLYIFLAGKVFIYLFTCTRFRTELWQTIKYIFKCNSCRRRDKVTLVSTNTTNSEPGTPHKHINPIPNTDVPQDKHTEESKSTDV